MARIPRLRFFFNQHSKLHGHTDTLQQQHCKMKWPGDQSWWLTLPLVRVYISEMVLVDRSLRGFPLSPPTSLRNLLCRDSGRDIVVLHTIRPSTLLWTSTTFTKHGPTELSPQKSLSRSQLAAAITHSSHTSVSQLIIPHCLTGNYIFFNCANHFFKIGLELGHTFIKTT